MENSFLSQINDMKSVTKIFVIFAVVTLLLKFKEIITLVGFNSIEIIKSVYSTISVVYIILGAIILAVAYLKDDEMRKMGENLDKKEEKLEQRGLAHICAFAIALIVIGLIFLA